MKKFLLRTLLPSLVLALFGGTLFALTFSDTASGAGFGIGVWVMSFLTLLMAADIERRELAATREREERLRKAREAGKALGQSFESAARAYGTIARSYLELAHARRKITELHIESLLRNAGISPKKESPD